MENILEKRRIKVDKNRDEVLNCLCKIAIKCKF